MKRNEIMIGACLLMPLTLFDNACNLQSLSVSLLAYDPFIVRS
jgi:hypothetical protein